MTMAIILFRFDIVSMPHAHHLHMMQHGSTLLMHRFDVTNRCACCKALQQIAQRDGL